MSGRRSLLDKVKQAIERTGDMVPPSVPAAPADEHTNALYWRGRAVEAERNVVDLQDEVRRHKDATIIVQRQLERYAELAIQLEQVRSIVN